MAGDLCASALLMLGAVSLGGPVQADDAQWSLECLQRRIDLANAQKQLIYAVNFQVFACPPNVQPISIGPAAPAGHFVVPDPPVRIESANWILPGTNGDVDLPPMQILSDQDWAAISIKNLKSTLPTALYYSRAALLGSVYLLPIPNVANNIRLQLWSGLRQALAVETVLAMPPAYWSYLMCAIATDMAPSYGPRATQMVDSNSFMLQYREARNAVQANNSGAPALKSDAPSSSKGRAIPDFNFLTGQRS
jgi:hypothetical protein